MADAATLQRSLIDAASRVEKNREMSEGSVYDCFVSARFFQALGYEDFGVDILSHEAVGGKVPDYYCRDAFSVRFVIEFKKPTDRRPLLSYGDGQLRTRYVIPLRARYAVLTNGEELYLFERRNGSLLELLHIPSLKAISAAHSQRVYDTLTKRLPTYASVTEIHQVLDSIEDLAISEAIVREDFFVLLSLRPTSRLGELLKALLDLFRYWEGFPAKENRFFRGAYEFWAQSYARDIDIGEIPSAWKPFVSREHDLKPFMFCLETAHALTSRLILAKVCQDNDLVGFDARDWFVEKIRLEYSVADLTNAAVTPLVLHHLLERVRASVAESIFEEDIFNWWVDPFDRAMTANRMQTTKGFDASLEHFGAKAFELFATVFSLDFGNLSADLLGDLYQHYFDEETRKALGEFYTRPEVVAGILDMAGYVGKVSGKRILDPACGSGTFLVEALNRYLKNSANLASKVGWAKVLDELCHEPRVVGFDINPFAVLMSQIRFMMGIVPYYKQAKSVEPAFAIDTLPIFRTDSLVVETKAKAGKVQMGLSRAGVVPFEMRLPVRRKPKSADFLRVRFDMPVVENGPLEGLLHSSEEYYACLRLMFRVLKDHARRGIYDLSVEDLNASLVSRFDGRSDGLSAVLYPYATRILKEIEKLKTEYDDGRLVKSLEDLVLAGILKNFVKYDVVVANPPYVSILRVTKDDREYYLKHYQLATGRINLYILFYEMGLNVLADDGVLGFISPSAWQVYSYGRPLRGLLRDDVRISAIVDLANAPSVFDQDVATGIFILRKRPSEASAPFAVVFKKDKPSLLPGIRRILAKCGGMVRSADLNAYPIGSRGLSGLDRGIISAQISERADRVLGLLESNSIPLWQLKFNIEQCIRIGSAETRKRLLLDVLSYRAAPKSVRKECRRLLDGADVQPFQVRWRGLFLRYRRRELYNPKSSEIFEQPKLLFRNTSKRLTIALDRSGFYALNTIYAIVPERNSDASRIPLEFVLGVLSSDVAEFFYRSYFWGLRIPGGSMKYREVLKYLRLPRWNEKNGSCLDLVKSVEALGRRRNLEARLNGFPHTYLDDAGWFESTLLKWHQKGDVVVSSPVVQPDLNGDLALSLGRTRVELPAWAEEVHARFIDRALMGRRFRNGETVQVPLPRSPRVVARLLAGAKKDEAKVATGQSASDLMDEINRTVYELFSASQHRKFISDFHADFTPPREWYQESSAGADEEEEDE